MPPHGEWVLVLFHEWPVTALRVLEIPPNKKKPERWCVTYKDDYVKVQPTDRWIPISELLTLPGADTEGE
jgi:hypothetical protein